MEIHDEADQDEHINEDIDDKDNDEPYETAAQC